MKKVDKKVKEMLAENTHRSGQVEPFYYTEGLKYMVQWTLGELRNTVYGDEDAMDTLQEIIEKSGLG